MSLDLLSLEPLIKTEFPQLTFYGFDKLNSTSTFLKSKANSHRHAFCIANIQTDGYGQRQREWLSNNDSLTFSLLHTTRLPINQSKGLAQFIGARLCHLLNTVCDDKIFIKWPNDLFTAKGKVSGLLIESCGESEGEHSYIIGIGINLSAVSTTNTDYSIFYLSPKLTLENFILVILDNLITSLECFANRDSKELSLLFSKYDYFTKGQNVFVYDNGLKTQAIYDSISSQGEVCLYFNNKKRCFHSGMTSIRAK